VSDRYYDGYRYDKSGGKFVKRRPTPIPDVSVSLKDLPRNYPLEEYGFISYGYDPNYKAANNLYSSGSMTITPTQKLYLLNSSIIGQERDFQQNRGLIYNPANTQVVNHYNVKQATKRVKFNPNMTKYMREKHSRIIKQRKLY
jgi:hypothetical protein